MFSATHTVFSVSQPSRPFSAKELRPSVPSLLGKDRVQPRHHLRYQKEEKRPSLLAGPTKLTDLSEWVPPWSAAKERHLIASFCIALQQ